VINGLVDTGIFNIIKYGIYSVIGAISPLQLVQIRFIEAFSVI